MFISSENSFEHWMRALIWKMRKAIFRCSLDIHSFIHIFIIRYYRAVVNLWDDDVRAESPGYNAFQCKLFLLRFTSYVSARASCVRDQRAFNLFCLEETAKINKQMRWIFISFMRFSSAISRLNFRSQSSALGNSNSILRIDAIRHSIIFSLSANQLSHSTVAPSNESQAFSSVCHWTIFNSIFVWLCVHCKLSSSQRKRKIMES